ncbi:hypothetical protein, partial [Ectothiorhodospira variabilis]|uniref:hypothetical protein n=1 Tax=Ectothiorhodospira variabilis TaxID=505694 RepID=UPI001EFBF817
RLGLVLVARFMTAEVLAQGRLLTCLDFWRAPIDFLVARFAGGRSGFTWMVFDYSSSRCFLLFRSVWSTLSH